jgi:hypothetical protein
VFRRDTNRKRTKGRLACLAFVLTFGVLLAAEAKARHNGHEKYIHRSNPYRNADLVRHPTVHGGPLRIIMADFIQWCEQQAAELKNFPADEIAQGVALDDAQAAALSETQNIAHETAEALAETCPPAVSPIPADRLDMIERGIDGIDATVKALLPALTALYGSLNDEQKAHLVLRFAGLETDHGRAAETTGSASHAIDDETRRGSKQPGSDVGDASSARRSRGWWNCEQWQAELRAWPVERVEQSIALVPRQRGAFYTLAAAVQQAADTLAGSCPQDTSVTPVARLLELKKKLDGVSKSIAALRPPLSGFYEVLDSDQRSRFNDAL